ncbi:MAG: FadR/GntR family transcriptional regulator [Lacisediminihabitans sp.]
MPPRRPLAEDLADALLNDILNGKYPPGSLLPSEVELAELSGMSRLTVREAVKALRAKRVLQVNQGRGTFVNPPARWSVLDPVLLIARSSMGEDSLALERKFLEARRIVEVAVAQMAAERRTDDHLELLSSAIARMTEAASKGDVEVFVEADIAFHQHVMEAAGNPFIAALFEPMSQILHLTRHQTSAHAPVREHAIESHQHIYDALVTGDPSVVAKAMTEHMMQTENDLDTYVRDSARSLLAVRRHSPSQGIAERRAQNTSATNADALAWAWNL